MTIVEWLNNVKKINFMIDNLISQEQQIRDLMLKITPAYSDMPSSRSGVSDKTGSCMAKLIDIQQRTNDMVDHYVDYRQNVITALEKLPAMQYQVLYLHYIRFMTLDDIAAQVGYSSIQVWRIKRDGLKALENMMGHEVECYTIAVL